MIARHHHALPVTSAETADLKTLHTPLSELLYRVALVLDAKPLRKSKRCSLRKWRRCIWLR
jgi:hypothetical protein